MAEIAPHHRPFLLLASVLLAQVLLLAFQVKTGQDVRLIRVWAVELLTPVQRGGTWAVSTVRGGWRNYVDLRRASAENQRLQSELDRLRLRNFDLESTALEQERVAKLAEFRQAHAEVPMLSARIVGANADSASHTLYINRGESDGLRRNMGVIVPDGVVGKITEVYSSTAQILLINDKDSGVGALLAASRTHGVARGMGEENLRLDYVINDQDVAVGEKVVTSGEDQIFPKDLPVGAVVSTQAGNPFKTIRVRPAARLDRLEDVMVLLSQQDLFPAPPATVPAPSAAAPPPAGNTLAPKGPSQSTAKASAVANPSALPPASRSASRSTSPTGKTPQSKPAGGPPSPR